MFVYFLGETVARGWTVALLWSFRHSIALNDEVKAGYAIALIGAGVSLVGALCCIRIFSPARWGPWPWLVSAALAVSVSIIVAST